MRTFRQYLGVTAKGLAMGAADVVPGVSGGTIAFISGIYEELISSIRSVNFHAAKLLFAGKFIPFWRYINGSFLVALLAGIGISILSLSRIILYMLENHPVLVWSFFFGLIAASAFVIGATITKWNLPVVLFLIAGIVVAYAITVISPAETPESWWFILLCGSLAICAMILPGISGSFILLLLGKYEYIFSALTSFNFKTISLFAFGCIIGILSFSHLLAWMFRHYKDITIALLSGFMIGSLNKVWPWKVPDITRIVKGEERIITEKNLLPSSYENATGEPAYFFYSILLFLLAIVVIVFLERTALRKNQGHV